MIFLGLLVFGMCLTYQRVEHVAANVLVPRVLDGEEVLSVSPVATSMVSLWYSVDAVSKQFRCAGTLIHQQWLITAASCFMYGYNDASKWTVIAGRLNDLMTPERFERSYDVSRIIPKDGEDIALVQLASCVYTNRGVTYYPNLDLDRTCSAQGAECKIYGWGFHAQDQALDKLHRGNVTVSDLSTCPLDDETEDKVLDETLHVCATGGASVCTGDEGGAVVCRCPGGGHKLVAVIRGMNMVTGCRSRTYYTRVSALSSRIQPIMQNLEECPFNLLS